MPKPSGGLPSGGERGGVETRGDGGRGRSGERRKESGKVREEGVVEEGREEEEEEDDGWLLLHVWDDENAASEVWVLDAKQSFECSSSRSTTRSSSSGSSIDDGSVAAEPIARVLMPKRVPFGFHGAFVPMQ